MQGDNEKPEPDDDQIFTIHPLEDGEPILTRAQRDAVGQELREKEEMKIHRPPAIPEGWKSAAMLKNEVRGDTKTYNQQFIELIARKQQEGLTKEEIQAKWIGRYFNRGNVVLYASPQAVMLLLSEKLPFFPEGWKSATMLSREIVGNSKTLNRRFEELIARKRSEGLPSEIIQTQWAGRYSYGNGNALFASPQAIEIILSEKNLPAPLGWKSGNMLGKEFGGVSNTYNHQFEELIADKQKDGFADEDIRTNWVGFYSGGGRQALYASPQAVEIILSAKAHPVPTGWKSGEMVGKEFGGGRNTYHQRLEELINQKRAEGLTEEEIRTQWGGYYSFKGAPEALYGSPQAIEAIIANKASPAPHGWKSGSLLHRTGGNSTTYNRQFEELIANKRKEGLTDEEIQKQWVGRYSNRGRQALFASPQAIEVILSRKAPSAPSGWKNGRMLSEECGGDSNAYKRKFEELIANKKKEGLTEEEVQTQWIGSYSSGNGSITLFASPQAITLLLLQQAPLVPAEWRSGEMLKKEFVIGNRSLNSQLKELIEKKKAEGLAEEDIQTQWAGRYAHSINGVETLFGSPQAIEELKKQGILRPRVKNEEAKDKNSNFASYSKRFKPKDSQLEKANASKANRKMERE